MVEVMEKTSPQLPVQVHGPQHHKVFLRPLDLSDADVVTKCLMDDRVCRSTRWDTCKTKEEAVSVFRNALLEIGWCRAICVEGEGPVGFIFFQTFSGTEACRADAGICIAFEHWSRGIASVATRMAAEQVLDELPHVQRLDARTIAGNDAAEAVLKNAGFRREVLLRRSFVKSGKVLDQNLYSRLRPHSTL